jgi:hypothetical protein
VKEMELIEILILINLISTFILFLGFLYLFGKLKLIELIIKSMKSPEQVFEQMMKNKIPILRNEETGEYIIPGQENNKGKTTKNPITG